MSEATAYERIASAFGDDATAQASAELSPEKRAELRRFWVARADGELTTALSFEYMLSDLQQLGAPDTLTTLAERAIADEHRHVDWCLRFARLFGDGEPAQAAFGGTRPLSFEGASERDQLILRTVFGGCFSETIAVHVLLASQVELGLESVQRLNRQHVAEEVRHARLGWGLVSWPGLDARDRDMVSEFVPEMALLARRLWCTHERSADAELHGLGYLSTPLVTKACERAFEAVIYPGLDASRVRV